LRQNRGGWSRGSSSVARLPWPGLEIEGRAPWPAARLWGRGVRCRHPGWAWRGTRCRFPGGAHRSSAGTRRSSASVTQKLRNLLFYF
jgi:hypothetical protein